ncbi:hypothetical protein ACP3V3_19770 [Vibrio sp. PNB22_3_1]
MKASELHERALELDRSVMLADGLDEALVGYLISSEHDGWLTSVYSIEKIIRLLVLQGMSEDEAWEWFDFNIEGAYVGPGTPVYINTQ